MGNDVFWAMLAALAVFANRVTEAVKAWLKINLPADTDPRVISLAALVTSAAVGVLGALALNLNFVAFLLTLVPDNPYLANLSPLAGVLLTGCFASAGSELIQWLTDLLAAGRERLTPGDTAVIVEAAAKSGGAKAAVKTSGMPVE